MPFFRHNATRSPGARPSARRNACQRAAYAARWQAFLRAEGLAPGDRVALCLKNGIHWVASDQGALGLGIVVVPLYADDNPENVAWRSEERRVGKEGRSR